MSTIKQIKIKKARKDHHCNACEWLRMNCSDSKSLFNEYDFTEEEKESILKAESNKWMIKKGESCEYRVGIWDGEFYAFYIIPEIDDICVKYDLYDY